MTTVRETTPSAPVAPANPREPNQVTHVSGGNPVPVSTPVAAHESTPLPSPAHVEQSTPAAGTKQEAEAKAETTASTIDTKPPVIAPVAAPVVQKPHTATAAGWQGIAVSPAKPKVGTSVPKAGTKA